MGYGYNALDGRLVTQIGVGYSASYANRYEYDDMNIGLFLNTQYFINNWFSIIPEIAFFENLSNFDGSADGFSIVAGVMAVLSF